MSSRLVPEVLSAHVVPFDPPHDLAFLSPWEMRELDRDVWEAFGARLALALCTRENLALLRPALRPFAAKVASWMPPVDKDRDVLTWIAAFGKIPCLLPRGIDPACHPHTRCLFSSRIPVSAGQVLQLAKKPISPLSLYPPESVEAEITAEWLSGISMGNPRMFRDGTMEKWTKYMSHETNVAFRDLFYRHIVLNPSFLQHGNRELFSCMATTGRGGFPSGEELLFILRTAALPIVDELSDCWEHWHRETDALAAADANPDKRVRPWLAALFKARHP